MNDIKPHFLSASAPFNLGEVLDALQACQVPVRSTSLSYSDRQGHLSLRAVTSDSRSCVADSLFCAHSGTIRDAHGFIPQALAAGATALLVEEEAAYDVPYINVESGRKALSAVAAYLTDNLQSSSRVVGITGTNGKTTTAHLVRQLLGLSGGAAASIGTLGVRSAKGDLQIATDTTTPDPLYLHGLLRELRSHGIHDVALEVSSHAIDQERVAHVPFAINIFTNLTQDHLDYHVSMEAYRDAKFRLFLSNVSVPALVCIDDPYGKELIELLRAKGLDCSSYGFSPGADWQIEQIGVRNNYQAISLRLPTGACLDFESALLGRYNACNLVAALVACQQLGIPVQDAVRQCTKLGQAPGRLERFDGAGFTVFVDYAHTPDALANVLKATRLLCARRLWVVFGCGGDRDRSKRPLMLAAARALADSVVVTTDNPRTEDPQHIVADMLSQGGHADFIELDRREAIVLALSQAQSGDVVLIAGKGHEDYQIVGTEKRFFSDQAVVSEYLSGRV